MQPARKAGRHCARGAGRQRPLGVGRHVAVRQVAVLALQEHRAVRPDQDGAEGVVAVLVAPGAPPRRRGGGSARRGWRGAGHGGSRAAATWRAAPTAIRWAAPPWRQKEGRTPRMAEHEPHPPHPRRRPGGHHGRRRARAPPRLGAGPRQPHRGRRAGGGAPGAGRRGHRRPGPPRHPRPRQHPPPHGAVPHPGGAVGAGRRALLLAAGALPDLGRPHAGDGDGGHPDRHGGAPQVGLHHHERPLLHLPERLPARRQHRGGRPRRHALHRHPRRHERGEEPGRACRPTRWWSRSRSS